MVKKVMNFENASSDSESSIQRESYIPVDDKKTYTFDLKAVTLPKQIFPIPMQSAAEEIEDLTSRALKYRQDIKGLN